MTDLLQRAENEIAHGRYLAENDPEIQWGWGTPAGRVRSQRRAQLIIQHSGLEPRVHALEIGCGTGLFTEKFAESGATIVAVDISAELLERARSRQIESSRVRFLLKRFEDCDLEGPFDAVIGSSVIHHLELSLALEQIARLLKPGGWLCFAEPNMLNPQVFLERKLADVPGLFPYVSPDETAFVRWRLGRQLRHAGFESVQITPFDWLHPWVPAALIKPVLAFGSLLERTPVLREFSGSLLITARRPA